jgi:hypothetical protein
MDVACLQFSRIDLAGHLAQDRDNPAQIARFEINRQLSYRRRAWPGV